ncbi:MAG TPA: SIS domain-containing protein [Desulfotignum sp.]|nr:SIS domain-containing protein [Desulfotignum sp.]
MTFQRPLLHRITALFNRRITGLRNRWMRCLGTPRITRFFPCIALGKSLDRVPANTLVLFPVVPNRLCCGICALVTFKGPDPASGAGGLTSRIDHLADRMKAADERNLFADPEQFCLGEGFLTELWAAARALKQESAFQALSADSQQIETLTGRAGTLAGLITGWQALFAAQKPGLPADAVEIIALRLEQLRDILWCLEKELLDNITAVRDLAPDLPVPPPADSLLIFRRINAVLASIDRLEVRGRDSAGISVLFTLDEHTFDRFREQLAGAGLSNVFKQRTRHPVLANNSITVSDRISGQPGRAAVAFVYKFAAEIGALGDNVAFIRSQIRTDLILQALARHPVAAFSVSAHTRWASVGDITEANCHPVDNAPADPKIETSGIIHVCLNGDIDNYLELKTEYEARYDRIHPEINTDTKLIPLQIQHHLRQGADIETAFRLAVNDFEGSHAISMHTDLAPGTLFLAQKGSGQALFVGIAPDGYMAASELYGVVEETPWYVKLNGEQQGQIVILDPDTLGGLSGIRSCTYDGTPVAFTQQDVRQSRITARDIHRHGFPHYFLKEISESPESMEKTLENKVAVNSVTGLYETRLGTGVIPEPLQADLVSGRVKKIFFIGQGTAGVAARGCADLLAGYLGDRGIEIRALKSSELSGFCMTGEDDASIPMDNTLVVAISQSGTTTDTNRTVDMIRAAGARTLAIVNRRDSDLTFKVDGVLYTSSGRDIEMSVASTKAFYAQITAGVLLGLHLAAMTRARSPEFISREIRDLMAVPDKMRTVLGLREAIRDSAFRLAVTRNYWATVGSGANKTAADEIRIKLSELCYKTISSDYVEDKKHIDLSAEPLIIVCAAGTRESVLADIVKDTAIFHAHKATPVVIATQGDDRFDLYAADVFKVPEIKEAFAPILNTLVGHLWGYYAALAINEGSRFMYQARAQVQEILDGFIALGHDAYEVLLEKKFREHIAGFYNRFSKKRRENGFPDAMGLDTAANITLLLKYLSGRLPVSDFEIDFQIKGTPANMLTAFFDTLNLTVNNMARPVDAIKHQAKTVTVGTSRIRETFQGQVFDELARHGIQISQITTRNVLVIKHLQEVIARVNGGLLYRITGLNLLGEVTADTRIRVVEKTGTLAGETSRVETDHQLKGTKNIIVREGNVYIGKGRKDKKNILVIPVLSPSPATPNIIEYILSLRVAFRPSESVSLLKKIKALGGKYPRLKDWILESENVPWDDRYLNLVPVETLFGDTAEQVVAAIIAKLR